MTRIRPKLAWRVGLLAVPALLFAFGRSLGAYVIAAMLLLLALYAWTTTVDVRTNAVEKHPWGRRRERVSRPVAELEYLRAPLIGRRAIEIGPIGSSIVLELVFWNRRALRALVRDLLADARALGDDESRARLLRFARVPDV